MKPPADLPSTLVALGEAFARKAEIDSGDFWAYLYRQKAPPPELRAAIVEALFPAVSPGDFLLPAQAENGTLRTMSASQIEPPRAGRPIKNDRLAKAMKKANRGAGVTLAEIAIHAKRSTASVRSWSYPKSDPSHRPAPRAVVEAIRDVFGIPLSVWPEVID